VEADREYARRTWRYLRLAMVAVLIGLLSSVVIERLKVKPGCFQTSISAYYYTPVRGVFVAALVTLGVCLICLRGSTDVEDLLLNVAGMLAPVVAFVPTPDYVRSCTSVPVPIEQAGANVANNVVALLIISGVALLIIGGVLVFTQTTLPARIGGAIGVLLWTTTLVVFLAARDVFVDNAHNVAATALFVCIVGAAFDNAVDTLRRPLHVLYMGLAVAMLAALGIIALIGNVTGWEYWTILLEVVVLALFVLFWLVQTADLWGDGIRPRSKGRRRPAPIRASARPRSRQPG
jgi:dipeptide/tripeptide permease